MKYIKNSRLALAAVSIISGSLAFGYSLKSFESTNPVPLHIPAAPDSISGENPFSPTKLLSSRGNMNFNMQRQDWTTILPDSEGMTSVKTESTPSITTLRTGLMANRFAKGKLLLKSTSPAKVMVDGVKLIEKTTSDSIPVEAEGALSLDPEAYRQIQINILSLPDDKVEPVFSLEFIPNEEFKDVEFNSGADLKQRFSVKTCIDGPRVLSTEISPDGKYVILKYSNIFDADTRTQWSSIVETATGRVLSSDLPANAKWMPAGSSIYYSVKNGHAYDIRTISLPSMQSKVMVANVPEEDVTFSPDSKYLFYYDKVEGKKDEGPLRRVKDPDDRIPGDRDRFYIVRYDINNDVALPLTYGGPTTQICDFTADGSRMLYLSSRQTPSQYPFYLTSIIEMDMNTLATDTIVKDDGYINSACYSPDGKRLFVTGGPDSFNSIGVNAGNHELPNNFDIQGYFYDIASGKVTPATRDFDPSISGAVKWNRKDGKIYFKSVEGFNKNIYSLNPANMKFEKLDAKLPNVANFSIGDNEAQWISYTGQSFTEVGVAYLMNLKNGNSRLLDDPSASIRERLDLGKIEPWVFTASDGTSIDGIMCLPPQFDASKKYPLIVYYYGGTTPSDATMSHAYAPELFASRDYVVYVVNPSGTIGYGQEFSARHVNAWGIRTADDIIEGVKQFCKEHPFVDDKKIGCLGASYGGFMTQYLQTKTDIFAAAVSHAGISNVTSYWGEGFWGYSYNSVAAAKSYPWSNPELFTKQGSLFNADKIHTPLLLLHGSRDTNVPIGESIQLFNALKVLGRDVEFITVDDQDHVITDYDKRQIWQNTIMAFFAKYLQNDPAWWDSMYGN